MFFLWVKRVPVEICLYDETYAGISSVRMEFLMAEITYTPDDIASLNSEEIIYKKYGTTVKLRKKEESFKFSKFLSHVF